MKNRKRKSRKKNRILFLVEIIVLLVLVVGVFAYAKVNEGLRKIGTGNGSGNSADPNLEADSAGENSGITDARTMHGYTNIALVGIDTRDNKEIDYANSDTMLIASINNDTQKVRIVSVYRDTLLNINPDGTKNEGGDGSDLDDGTAAVVGTDDSSDDGGDGSDDQEEENVGDNGDEDDDDTDDQDDGDDTGDYDGGDDNEDYNDDEEDYDTEQSSNRNSEYSSEQSSDRNSNETTGTSSSSESSSESEASSTSIGGTYDKANSAYMRGSAKQLLTMLNMNLDLNIHDYVVVDFKSMSKLIDDLGGLDLDLLHDEVVHINNYAKETSKVTGNKYKALKVPKDDGSVNTYHLNGDQAVSYARIRYTTGNDPKRTQRQRVVIEKIVEKAKKEGINGVTAIINDVLPLCRTSLSNSEIIQMARSMMGYEIEKTTGWPFAMLPKDVYPNGEKCDALIPVTLAQNVSELHEFLFDEESYTPSETVQEISNDIIRLSQLGENSVEEAKQYGTVPSIGGETDKLK